MRVLSLMLLPVSSVEHHVAVAAEGDQVVNFSWLSQSLIAQMVNLQVFSCPADGASETIDSATLSSDAPPLAGAHVRIIVHKLSRSYHLLSALDSLSEPVPRFQISSVERLRMSFCGLILASDVLIVFQFCSLSETQKLRFECEQE